MFKRCPWIGLLAFLGACSYPMLPVEGGMYPSTGQLLGLTFSALFLVPAVATAVVYGLMKLIRSARKLRIGVVFSAAWLTWMVGFVLVSSHWGQYLGAEGTLLLFGGLSFAVAAVVGYWFSRPPRPPVGPPN
ncbi:hypothetical protein IC235_00575 [Hymenobacter sp. BT664]|uniref:Lipoprotein n=1 Tax=Hymenobacter montanus TaxID=2771359 RepID=A0A927BA71_9BACT|nr:hypothetical protein [Hymenobacter montanus]MBD2766382.1 hypothetical protein [Hymenobacter montanus]